MPWGTPREPTAWELKRKRLVELHGERLGRLIHLRQQFPRYPRLVRFRHAVAMTLLGLFIAGIFVGCVTTFIGLRF